MEKIYWKIIAIISIIIVFILGSIMGYAITKGLKALDREKSCIENCINMQENVSYYYDDSKRLCYCYHNSMPIYRGVMG